MLSLSVVWHLFLPWGWGLRPRLTPRGEIVHVVIYVAHCVEDIFTSWSMFPEQLPPLSWLYALSHSDSPAVKTLLTSTVSDKIALGTNNFIWMFLPFGYAPNQNASVTVTICQPFNAEIYSSDRQSDSTRPDPETPRMTIAEARDATA